MSAPNKDPDPPSVSAFPIEQQSNSERSHFTLLLVEDNETDVFIIRDVLRNSELRYHLVVVSDGEQALRFLHDDSHDCPRLVVLDLNVPKVPGLEVLRQLRAGKCCKDVPVIVLTSSSAAADRRATSELGANAYFTKPTALNDYYKLSGVLSALLRSTER